MLAEFHFFPDKISSPEFWQMILFFRLHSLYIATVDTKMPHKNGHKNDGIVANSYSPECYLSVMTHVQHSINGMHNPWHVLYWMFDISESLHYNDVIMSAMVSHITGVSIVCLIVYSGAENIKTPRHWLLWGESIGGRWIPLTKGQKRGKCFDFMTPSWRNYQRNDNSGVVSAWCCTYP